MDAEDDAFPCTFRYLAETGCALMANEPAGLGVVVASPGTTPDLHGLRYVVVADPLGSPRVLQTCAGFDEARAAYAEAWLVRVRELRESGALPEDVAAQVGEMVPFVRAHLGVS